MFMNMSTKGKRTKTINGNPKAKKHHEQQKESLLKTNSRNEEHDIMYNMYTHMLEKVSRKQTAVKYVMG